MTDEKLKISRELKSFARAVDNSTDSFFIAGKAGTGKSTLIKWLKQNSKQNLVVLAPTGVASVNVSGQTIHSFFGFPLTFVETGAIKESRNKDLFRNLDTLVIDEISMVRADVLDGIDYALRINRNKRGEPFGGVKLIFVGDLHQLAPVVETELRQAFSRKYPSPYFFSSNAFARNRHLFKFQELNKIYRQQDAKFISLLHEARSGQLSAQSLQQLNSRCVPGLNLETIGYIILTSKNEMANRINTVRLSRLIGKEQVYPAETWGEFNPSSYPTELELKLKPGAKVMFLKNDSKGRWVNGSLGIVKIADEDLVTVVIGDAEYEVEKAVWQKIKYVFNAQKNTIDEQTIGEFTQYPLRLAWAVTIHKSQGMTFDKVVIDLGAGAFSHGQTYVALSRCRTLEGVYLKRLLRQADFIFDRKVLDFYKMAEQLKIG